MTEVVIYVLVCPLQVFSEFIPICLCQCYPGMQQGFRVCQHLMGALLLPPSQSVLWLESAPAIAPTILGESGARSRWVSIAATAPEPMVRFAKYCFMSLRDNPGVRMDFSVFLSTPTGFCRHDKGTIDLTTFNHRCRQYHRVDKPETCVGNIEKLQHDAPDSACHARKPRWLVPVCRGRRPNGSVARFGRV